MDATNQIHKKLNCHETAVNFGKNHLPEEVCRNMISTPFMSGLIDIPVEVISAEQDLPVIAANKWRTPKENVSFLRELEDFYREKNTDLKTKRFYGNPIDLYKLWNEVMKFGGYDKVSELKKWRQVGDMFHPPTSCTAVSAIFRTFYEKALLDFEHYKRQKGDLQHLQVDPECSNSRVKVIVAKKWESLEEKTSFLRELEDFYRGNNTNLKTVKFYGNPIDLYKLWIEVMKFGGYDKVSELKKWRQVGDIFHPPASCTAVAAIFRKSYEKTLLNFENYKRKKGDLQHPPADPEQFLRSRVEEGDCPASGSGCAQKDTAAEAFQFVHAGSSEPADEGPQNGGVRFRIADIGPAADLVKTEVRKNGNGYDIYALVAGFHKDEIKVESDLHGRVVITGMPGDLDNAWGTKPFTRIIMLPLKIDPTLTKSEFQTFGRLQVHVHPLLR